LLSSEKQYAQEVLLNDKKEQFLKWKWEDDFRGVKMIKITF